MINIIEFINKENLTLSSVEAIKESDLIIVYSKDLLGLEGIVNSDVIFIEDLDNIDGDYSESDYSKLNVKACELAISKSFENKKVSIISNEFLKFGFRNLIYQIASKYSKKVEINIYPTVSAVDYISSLIGAPLDDFSVINFGNYLIPLYEFEKKIEHSLKSNFILAIHNPVSNKELFDKFKSIVLEIIPKETLIAIVDFKTNSKKIISLEDLDMELINENSFLIIGNRFTYKYEDLMITSRYYEIKKDLISYNIEFFEKYLNNETPCGFDHNCEYLPCHENMEACDFCYCPFYPCGDSSTGGKWIEDRDIWNCVDCIWIHQEEPDKCIRKGLDNILMEIDDLNNKKDELLRLRRECVLKTK